MNSGSKFKDIDPVLDNWLRKNGLSVFRSEYRDIAIIDSHGVRYSLRIEPKSFFGSYKINASSNPGALGRRRIWTKKASRRSFEDALDEAYLEIAKWIKQNGGTRRKAG